MNSWLSNISVNMKLALGFGLVLALTLLMAISDWLSLDKLIDRSNWMSDITRLNGSLTNLRVARLQYMLTDGDETAAQNVQASIDAFSAQQSQLIATFQSPENLKLLKEQQEIIGRYERALVTMRKAYVESAVSRANMDRNAAQAQDAAAKAAIGSSQAQVAQLTSEIDDSSLRAPIIINTRPPEPRTSPGSARRSWITALR